ncbi:MAG: CARDB domain-containing protein, partial [Calditrichia bacterium]
MHKFTILFLCLGLVATVFAASTQQNSEAVPSPTAIETVWGPDAFGYTAMDSNEPGGPPVDWIDISGIGTVVTGLGDDNIVGPYDVGFPFRFYWYDVTNFYIGSNGYLRFSGTGQLSSPFTTIPNPVPPNDLVCMYAADFDPTSGGTVYYWTNNTDTVIVSFVGVPAWNTPASTGSFDFQVVLSAVDSSITFNYGTLTGPFYNTNGMVGIENNAGNIGIYNYPTNVVPQNYSIKFYYPSVILLDVHDIAVTRVQNNNSGGFFVETGNSFQTNATVKNAGNQDESNFYVIGEVRQYPSNTLVYEDSFLVANLNAGETQEIDFPEMFTMNTAGYYYVRVRSTLSGDMVASNDQIDVEMHVVDLPGELALDDGTSENAWSWAGGNGGAGIYYLPPVYPAKVTELKGYFTVGTLPTALLELYDDDGPNGEPGTQLASYSINVTTEGWYTQDVSGEDIVINDGGVYVVWMMTGDGSPGLGIDTNPKASRQTWEYTGVWAV